MINAFFWVYTPDLLAASHSLKSISFVNTKCAWLPSACMCVCIVSVCFVSMRLVSVSVTVSLNLACAQYPESGPLTLVLGQDFAECSGRSPDLHVTAEGQLPTKLCRATSAGEMGIVRWGRGRLAGPHIAFPLPSLLQYLLPSRIHSSPSIRRHRSRKTTSTTTTRGGRPRRARVACIPPSSVTFSPCDKAKQARHPCTYIPDDAIAAY